MSAPPEIAELVQKFDRRLNEYRSSCYNEEELRTEFVNPFFEALGWDVGNRQGLPGDAREVKLEEAIRVEESIRNPDFTFRVEGKRKFFVETKKPSVNIEGGIYPAFQVRRYAWSAGLSLSILTDFEELAVYDCRAEPFKTDKPAKARLLYLQYDQYVERWDEIAARFSKEAVLGGSLDRFIESVPEKRGTKRVDAALLEEISDWREMLAKNIALRNPALSQKDLNFAVQRTIDRILFLRICEDRAIEEYGRLKALLEGEGVYARLLKLFEEADERYNSGIFHFREERDRKEPPDSLTLNLAVDDRVLKQIIQDLYFPDSPYVFSEIPAEILGQVYEQFLGKVIVLDESHGAEVEYKPEVRKAGGVYYTPGYIVEYIVKNTVGKLLEGKTPQEASELRILDPACGSGSFLIGAYQYLLNWHKDWYAQNLVPLLEKGRSAASPEVQKLLPVAVERREDKRAKKIHARAAEASLPVFKANGNEWRLTTAERKRILLNNIYGVDIDPQAVEVTKLSLLLKVLEGETKESITSLLRYFRERALPDLGSNIKSGNSLIGWDILDDRPDLSTEELQRINPFDWRAEFPEVFQRGGFDAVIGNPPYIHSRAGLLIDTDKTYYNKHFKTAEYQINTFGLFLEKGIKSINFDGYLGMIVPNYWLSNEADSLLRKYLFLNNNIIEIVNTYNVFTNATVDTLLLFVQRENNIFPKHIRVKGIDRKLRTISERLNAINKREWNYNVIHSINDNQKDVKVTFTRKLNLNESKILNDFFIFKFGMKPYQVGKGVPPQTREIVQLKQFNSCFKINEGYEPLLSASDIKRYVLSWKGNWIKYGKHLAEPRNLDLFVGPRILLRRIIPGKRIDGVYTNEPYICNTDVITLQLRYNTSSNMNILYFLGVLLSPLCAYYLKSENINLDRAAFPKINTKTLSAFPIPDINLLLPRDKSIHDRMVSLVERMLNLHKQLATTKGEHERTLLQRQIEATDRQIDSLVYELYGLTEEEIRIVEEA